MRQSRTIVLLALACALFLRIWVPAGWMPAANGAFAIEPCVAALPASLALATHHHGGAHDVPLHKAQHQGDCAFAPLGAGLDVFEPPLLPIPVAASDLLHRHSSTPFFAINPPALPPPARGPPAVA